MFSREKTLTTMLKGRLARPPRLFVGGGVIRSKKDMKYLGFIVGQRMPFEGHVDKLSEKFLSQIALTNVVASVLKRETNGENTQ